MIAAAGLRNFHAGVRAGWDLNADPSLELYELRLQAPGSGSRLNALAPKPEPGARSLFADHFHSTRFFRCPSNSP